ncbi:autophagy-related protein Atg28 [Aspergillus steynii IBT 23096]|uniref:Autophagy-related protein Atg28 n=1 Tax=Aspergillus steynii IBT 23096 TaxID=1392250 RepID=A0A2I2GP04_9EURO|nr:autophagy-related protein Atg28 [Aspergillus steynii IBT 23096]PLB54607.1 autophagy-related protein Atg28 [Aspergillus steynii IBT 23096]
MSTVLFSQGQERRLQSPPLGASSHHQDPLVYIDRQAKHLERNLQALIDAQSEGLLAGLKGPGEDSSLSGESRTPSSGFNNAEGPSTVPIRQPAAKKISLRAAREGIFRSISDLLKLREEERDVLTTRVDERQDALQQIDVFDTKRGGLEGAISTIHNDGESQRSRELRDEGHQLESDIHEMETRLSQMKARQRQVTQELSQLENKVESKLSSYQASLALLESDIRKFLQHPPILPQPTNNGRQTFYSLNHKRRTLHMAQDHWTAEQTRFQKRQNEVDAEIEALEEGGGLWKRVVKEVTGFEKRLKTAMHRSITRQSQLLAPDGPSGSRSEDEQARVILDDLSNTTDRVEQFLELADEKDWRLLVCCIGAELEALREAREMLLGVFNVSEEDLWPSSDREEPRKNRHDDDNDSQADPLGVDNPEPPADLLRDAEDHSHDAVSRSGDDEDPDPAWLLPES